MPEEKIDIPSLEKRKADFPILYLDDEAKPEAEFWDSFEAYTDLYGFYCEEFVFNHSCDFSGKEFENANFSFVKFKGYLTSFREAKFRGTHSKFYKAIFDSDRTDFSKTVFYCERANFKRVEWLGEMTRFDWATFKSKYSVFSFGAFSGKILFFAGAEFTGKNTEFIKVQFCSEKTILDDIIFDAEVTLFNDSIFDSDEIRFHGVLFKRNTWFKKTIFKGKLVDFIESQFLGSTTFEKVKFQAEFSSFSNTIFSGDMTDFSDAQFVGENVSYLSGAKFIGHGVISFSGSLFNNHCDFIGWNETNEVEQGVQFEHSEDVDLTNIRWTNRRCGFRFFQANLAKVRFLGSDLRDAEFTAVRWARGQQGIVLNDESSLIASKNLVKKKEEIKSLPFAELERIYRDLKLNYETAGDFPSAGQFHIREKEMIRLNPRKKRSDRWLLNLYLYFGGYGEDFAIPLGWIGVLVLLSANVYSIEFGPSADSLLYAIQNIIPLNIGDIVVENTLSKFWAVGEKIFGTILLSLAIVGMRQRVKR